MEVDSSEVEKSDIDADTEVSWKMLNITPYLYKILLKQVEDAMKNGLKRSSSEPLINQLVAAEAAGSLVRDVGTRHR